MSWLSDSTQLVSDWMSSAYVGHGIDGFNVVNSGTNGGSIIGQATAVDPSKQYRLFAVSLPSGFTLNEDGSGQSTVAGVAVLKIYEDGIEL